MRRRSLPFLSLAIFALLILGCGKGSPVAPQGAILTISANPTTIGLSGTSTLTISALRSSGVAVNEGTEVYLSTNLGSVPAMVTTDASGHATAELVGTGQGGTATVTAASGAATSVTVDVAIGRKVSDVTLTATPSYLPANGGSVNILAQLRDDQGEPIPGVAVTFTSSVGTLDSGGGIVRSNDAGQAQDRLVVSSQEAGSNSSAQISVLASSGGSSVNESITVTILSSGS